jgi:hypothetical protein
VGEQPLVGPHAACLCGRHVACRDPERGAVLGGTLPFRVSLLQGFRASLALARRPTSCCRAAAAQLGLVGAWYRLAAGIGVLAGVRERWAAQLSIGPLAVRLN